MPSPSTVIRLQGGFCTAADLVAAGVPTGAVRRDVERGDIQRVRRGIYGVADAPETGLRAVMVPGRLAGVSAAETFGLWSGWSSPLHVVVPQNASTIRGRPGSRRGTRMVDGAPVVLHWNDDRRDVAWCWRVSVERCIRQVLRWNDSETALAVVDTALERRFIATKDLQSLCSGPVTPAEEQILACSAGSGSGVESIVRQRLERTGLPLRKQVDVPGVGPVDLAIAGSRIYLEIDGYEFHKSSEQFAEDRRRDAEGRSRGYVPIRFAAVQVRDDWPWVERMILAAVAQGSR